MRSPKARASPSTPSALGGSINLTGGLLDDLVLKAYRETIDPKSPMITLFNPISGPSAYWAETGFVTDARGVKTPNRSTRWTANLDTLKVNQPVTLTYDNGEGLKFTREIAVDDRYMFTVTDSVENSGSQPVSLRPYGLVLRRGKPQVAGYAVLHEGYVGVIGDSSVQEVTYSGIEKETNRVKTLEGVGGWLGFTDKYWASAIIPDQNASVEARFVATGTPPDEDFQSDVVEAPDNVAPGASATTVMHIFAGAKEVSAIDGYQKSLGIKKFDLMIDWGWFYFITKPLFTADRRHLPFGRQFRPRHSHRDRAGAWRAVSARQCELPLDGEDEAAAATDRSAEGYLSRRQAEAAAGANGAVPQGRGESGRRLPADGDPDPGVLCAL